MSNDVDELRAALFETLRGLKDGTIDADKARAINDTAQTLVNTAKVEIDYMRTISGDARLSSQFFGTSKDVPQLPDGTTLIGKGKGVSVTRHTLKG